MYFHVSDSDGSDEAMDIGKGKINFNLLMPLVNKGITEVRSKREGHPIEMLHANKTIAKMHKEFDRILMPLPMGAEDFLPVALQSIKKGGTIHFYDFLHQSEIPNKSIRKIERACKKAKRKCKIIRTVKCGQYSPKRFRVCVDFNVF